MVTSSNVPAGNLPRRSSQAEFMGSSVYQPSINGAEECGTAILTDYQSILDLESKPGSDSVLPGRNRLILVKFN
jgi:hypothetical protein